MLKSFLLLSCILTVAEASTDAPWLVGTGIADCTGPAAEVVMMGYGDSEHKTAGIHMRLYARAFIFVDPASHDRVAFVNVDTWAATEAVIQGVERKLHAWFQGQHYSRENLIVAGSHTLLVGAGDKHHGPAGASSYMLFQFSSAGRVHQSLDALVDGIAEAVWLAHHNIKPANVFFGNGMVDNSTVPNCPMPNCANRQRSPSSFMHNPEVERRKFFGEDNADRNMDLLKIVNAETGKPMGMVNWFGVHPTSLNSDYNLISGDNKGYASYAFEQDMNGPSWVQRAGRGPFVAAFAQGVSGDISPNLLGAWCTNSGEKCDNQWSVCWSNGQHKNSLCLGQGPGRDKYESMKILGSRQKTAAKTIFNRTTTPDLSKYWVDRDGNGTWVQTCEPCLGTSFAAGTTDGPTGMDEFGQTLGRPAWADRLARLKRVGFVLEEPSARCVLQNMQNVAFGLMLLALIGFVFGLLGIIAHDRLLSWTPGRMGAFGTAVTVGSDPCFLKHLRDSVALLGFQNRRLQESNGKLETQIKELSHISNSLDKVKGQLNNDAEATHDLLVALQHQGRVQAVSSSIGLFFVADRDKSGILDPKEAEVFLLGFSHLWDAGLFTSPRSDCCILGFYKQL
eukprot:g21031.t1